jgi:hypothetical protein
MVMARTVVRMAVTGSTVAATSHSDRGGDIVGGTSCDAETAVLWSGKGSVRRIWGAIGRSLGE